MYRLFAALEMPEHTHEDLLALQEGLAGAKWRPARNFHITLRFFGEMDWATAKDLDAALGDIQAPEMNLSLEGVGWFGSRQPSSVWARVREDEALRALSAQCEKAARRMGFTPDKHPYTPHVTLAYLSDASLEEVQDWCAARQDFRLDPVHFNSFHLFSSTMGDGPSRYRAEADYVLGDSFETNAR